MTRGIQGWALFVFGENVPALARASSNETEGALQGIHMPYHIVHPILVGQIAAIGHYALCEEQEEKKKLLRVTHAVCWCIITTGDHS